MKRVRFFEMRKTHPHRKKIRAFVHDMLRNPDPGSPFERKSKYIRWMPASLLFPVLRALRYDGLLLLDHGKIAASVMFQRHGNALHCFSFRVEKSHRGHGLSQQELLAFIEYARETPGIRKVRIGTNRNPAAVHACALLKRREKELGITVLGDGWVRLDRPPATWNATS